MGKASRRKAEKAKVKAATDGWLGSLSPEEIKVVEVAKATFEKVVEGLGMTEGCYNLAFFLREHLRRKYGIEVKIVVGWINDGEWDGAASHAWVEYQGKKIDIAIHKTSHPDVQPPGDVIILDHVFKHGRATYSYWAALPDSAAKALDDLRNTSPHLIPILDHKDREHQTMSEFALTQEGVDEYFRRAPATNKYETLARIVG